MTNNMKKHSGIFFYFYRNMLKMRAKLPSTKSSNRWNYVGNPIQREHDAIITSLWLQNDVAASFWRHNDVILRHLPAGMEPDITLRRGVNTYVPWNWFGAPRIFIRLIKHNRYSNLLYVSVDFKIYSYHTMTLISLQYFNITLMTFVQVYNSNKKLIIKLHFSTTKKEPRQV